LIGAALTLLRSIRGVQSTLVLPLARTLAPAPVESRGTTLTAVVMFALAVGEARAGATLDNPVLATDDDDHRQ
jgi:hypothetical protein